MGGLQGAEDGDEECQTAPLWSAVCCPVPEGKSGFSVGLIREAGEGVRQVSVKELAEMLGVTELFLEGCGGADGETVGFTAGLHSEGLLGNTEKLDADLTDESTEASNVNSNPAGQIAEGEEAASDTTSSRDSDEDIKDSREALTERKEVAGVDAQPEEADAAVGTEETSVDAATSESNGEEKRKVSHSRAVTSESPESLTQYENVAEQETDTNSSSALVFVLSTTLYIIKAPLRPFFSTITQLPGQVIQVTSIFY